MCTFRNAGGAGALDKPPLPLLVRALSSIAPAPCGCVPMAGQGQGGGSHAWSCIYNRPPCTLPFAQLSSQYFPRSLITAVIELVRHKGVSRQHVRTKPRVFSAPSFLLGPHTVNKFPRSLPSRQMWLPIRMQACSANLHQTPSSCQNLLHMLCTDNKAFQSSRGCRD